MSRIPLPELGRMTRHSWWTIVAGICVGLAAAVLVLDRIQPRFEATATVWTGEREPPPTPAPPGAGDGSRRLTTIQATLLRDEALMETVRRTYGLPEHHDSLPGLIETVRDNIRLTLGSRRTGSAGIVVRYRDTDARRAALTVNTLAEIYLARNPAGPETARGRAAGRLEAAAVPTVPCFPRPMRVYGVFLALGCLLFPVPAAVRRLLRPVISSEAGFVALSEIPLLASIPAAATDQDRSLARRRITKNVFLSLLSCAILIAAVIITSEA